MTQADGLNHMSVECSVCIALTGLNYDACTLPCRRSVLRRQRLRLFWIPSHQWWSSPSGAETRGPKKRKFPRTLQSIVMRHALGPVVAASIHCTASSNMNAITNFPGLTHPTSGLLGFAVACRDQKFSSSQLSYCTVRTVSAQGFGSGASNQPIPS
jgi:hypothetical protein